MQQGPSRIKLRLLIAAIATVVAAGFVALAFAAPLATRHPLLLITLDARSRYLILARHVDIVPFLVVATLRRVLTDPLYFLLGRWYGDRAIRWLETKGGGGEVVNLFERVFAKAAYPMVFLFPWPVVCALAGRAGMPFGAFAIVNVAGTITMVCIVRLFGDILGAPVDAILRFLNRNLVATTIVTIGCVVLSIVLNRVQGKSEIPPIDELEAEPDNNPEE